MMNLKRGLGLLAHQVGDGALGVGAVVVGDDDAEQPAAGRVERGLEEELRGHLAQALEAGDVRLGVLRQLVEDAVAVRRRRRPSSVSLPWEILYSGGQAR